MNADDDGFCEHFTIMRMTESKPDDLKILQAKNFISVFDDRVLVIIDWKENNYLRADRYTPSKYLEIYKNEIVGLSVGIPKVDKVATQDRIGKVRKEKNTIKQKTESNLDYLKKLAQGENTKYLEEKFSISKKDVVVVAEYMIDWRESTGRSYKNYKSAMFNWIRNKLQEGKIKKIEKVYQKEDDIDYDNYKPE
jgi:hypothetical protein